jgi:transcriptional regulator with XRE-family HTH domain
MKTHWTERSIKDYLFKIAADFITQLEEKMKLLGITQGNLAKKLNVSKGRVSQVVNNPGNIGLFMIIKYARALGMKVAIVAYDDNDPENKKGPVNSEIFNLCWERYGKPHDFWAVQDRNKSADTSMTSGIIYLDNASLGNIPMIPRYRLTDKATPSPNIQTQEELAI